MRDNRIQFQKFNNRKEQLNAQYNWEYYSKQHKKGKLTACERIEILISEGANVEKGTPLLLLEAMKMQNQILCSQSGIVKKIFTKEGDSVMANQLLIEIG